MHTEDDLPEDATLADIVEHDHEHNPDDCDECQKNAIEESNM